MKKMKNKQMEAVARLMYQDYRKQHDSYNSCRDCAFYIESGFDNRANFCGADFPIIWDAFFPELRDYGGK